MVVLAYGIMLTDGVPHYRLSLSRRLQFSPLLFASHAKIPCGTLHRLEEMMRGLNWSPLLVVYHLNSSLLLLKFKEPGRDLER